MFPGVLKIGGILIFGLVRVWIADSSAVDFTAVSNLPGATALGILAFKGFTAIANQARIAPGLLEPPHPGG